MSWDSPGPRASANAAPSADGWSTPAVAENVAPQDGFATNSGITLVTPNKPPLLPLGIGFGLSVVALLIGLIGQTATTGLIGWLLAGPLAISAVAFFTTADAKRREGGWYTPSDLALWGRRITIVVALIAVTVCAWFIANDVARGIWR